ncbi:MAG TPA: DUF2247 family protein [Thermoanaerobaculia bacterium]|nr:DUF2247 family protein [Thermoanaerobaculia bacterium]
MNFKLSSDFLRRWSPLTWREVEFGLQQQWLTNQTAIDLAIDRVTAADDARDVAELASVLPHEEYKVQEIVGRLADRDSEYSADKWLFLLLAWLYEHRDEIDDPLGVVEELYADFEYPEAIESFVRYMPPEDPMRVGDAHLFDAWRRYIDNRRRGDQD